MEKQKYIQVALKEPITVMVSIDVDFSQPLLATLAIDRVKRNLASDIRSALMERITTLHIDDLQFTFIEKSATTA